MELFIVVPLLTVVLTLMAWGVMQAARRNHVSLPRLKKSDRTPTLAAIDEMVEMDGHALTVDRLGGWRGRLLRSLVKAFSGGSLSVSDYESEVDRVVNATEPEAIALAAKQAAGEERKRKQTETEKAWAKKGDVFRKLLKDTLDIDARGFELVTHEYDKPAFVIAGAIYYMETNHPVLGISVGPKPDPHYIRVTKPCPQCGADIRRYNDRSYWPYGVPVGIKSLAALGQELENLEQRPHCGETVCHWKSQGKTDAEIQAIFAEERKKSDAARKTEQEAKLRNGWVDHTQGLVYGPGGKLVGSMHGQSAYPIMSGVYRGGYAYGGVGFSHVPYDLWTRPIQYRDTVTQESGE